MAEVNLRLAVNFHRRWWFMPAKIATIALIYIGLIRDIDRAARWLAENGMIMEIRIETAA